MRTPALHNIVIHSYIIIIKEIRSQLAIIYHAFIHALAYSYSPCTVYIQLGYHDNVHASYSYCYI